VNRKKKHKKSEKLKHLQADEVMKAGESVDRISSKSSSGSSRKTKAEQAFQKAKEERVCVAYYIFILFVYYENCTRDRFKSWIQMLNYPICRCKINTVDI